MKLHLGCGENRLDGYINIDQPSAAHTVQSRSVADEHADITVLRYPEASITEVRLHHVFEHFPRPVALALAASWGSWLHRNGVLHIEVPDFARTARAVLSPFSSRRARLVGMRHLYGSHEAPWAVHCEGWTAQTLSGVFRLCGVEVDRVRRTGWKGTYNIHVIGRRNDTLLRRDQVEQHAREWLRLHLLDDSPTEVRLLDVWMEAFRRQANRSWALPAKSTPS